MAKKSKMKKPAKKKAKKTVKRAASKSRRAPAKPKAKTRKPAPRKAKKPAPKKKKQIIGEGDYVASNMFLKDQAAFVKRNKTKIPQLGKDAEKALDGPEGASLLAAEQEAMGRSTID